MLGFALRLEKPNSIPVVQDMEPLPSTKEETDLVANSKTGFLFWGV
jgi:hypothetical protein